MRVHEDDLVALAEMRAASNIRRESMAETLEQWRQDNFGFLTAVENVWAKQLIKHVGLPT